MAVDMANIAAVFSRHTNIVFEFSGGKDSTAALYLLREYWPRMTVMWCAGDPIDELREYVQTIAGQLPRFVEVPGGLSAAVEQYGLPSDVMPFDAVDSAFVLGVGGQVRMQDRYSCCYRTFMRPMHEAVRDSGATLVIRGQKSGDPIKGPLSSGDTEDGIEFLYPIEGWTDNNVFSYLRLTGVGIPRYYQEGLSHSFDCAVCTAWIHEPRGAYLKKYYPVRFDEYREKLAIVAGAAQEAVNNLIEEVEVCRGTTQTQ